MSQLTMGQRIASRRKMLGMSQEALADKLEVSRQAVSKWESDGTIPEIDKLIALGSIFSVSIGWILGTESDPLPHPEEGFTETQLKTLEQIISHSSVRKRRLFWSVTAVAALAVAVISVMLWQVFERMAELSDANASAQHQLTQLSQNDDHIQSKIDGVSELLQAQSEKLLEDISIEAFASEDQRTITMTLYLKPKLYLESNTAYVSIKNPYSGYSDMVKCEWNGAQYILRHTVDIEDGYQFSFLLVNNYGYKEENLNDLDAGFGNLGVYSNFHLKIDDKCVLPEQGQCGIVDGVYYFNKPIHTPHLFAKSAVAYGDIVIKLFRNGEVIWERSYKEEFRSIMEGSALNSRINALLPQIEVPLPESKIGDRYSLIITAETVNGGAAIQGYSTELDVAEYTE